MNSVLRALNRFRDGANAKTILDCTASRFFFFNRNTQRHQDNQNQIDYVLCRLDAQQILLNARSYRGSIVRTDYSVEVTTIDLSNYPNHCKTTRTPKTD